MGLAKKRSRWDFLIGQGECVRTERQLSGERMGKIPPQEGKQITHPTKGIKRITHVTPPGRR